MKCFKFRSPFQRSQMGALLALVFATLVLSGCFKPQSRDSDPYAGSGAMGEPELQAATFYVDEVKGSSQVSAMLKGFSIPSQRTYNLAVCVKNKRSQDPVKGHRFVLSGGEKDLELQSEIDGCVRWTEAVSYNFLSKEKYVPFRRVLTASGIHSGARELRFAVNPWNFGGKAAEVVDLTRTKIPSENLASMEEGRALMRGQSTSGDVLKRQIWPKKGFEIESEAGGSASQGVERVLTLKVGAGVLLYDMENKSVVYELTEAKLKVEGALITQTNSGGKRDAFKIWQTAEPVELVREGDFFRAKVRVNLSMVSSTGSMLLALRLTAVDGPENLTPFEGLFEVSDVTKFISNGSTGAVLKGSNADGTFQFDQYAQGIKSLAQDMAQDMAQEVKPAASAGSRDGTTPSSMPSGISRIKAFKLTVDKPIYLGAVEDEETTRKTVRYSAKVCVNDNANGGKPASDVEFTIVKPDGVAIKKRTLNDVKSPGCLLWEDSISYKTFAPERVVLLPVVLRHDSGFEEKITLAINPWSPWSFGFDVNEAAEFIDKINKRTPIASRLLADGFGFDSVDHRAYEIDDYLTLKTIKRVRLRVGLRVQRDNNIRSGKDAAPEALRAGVYMLKAAIQTEFKDPSGKVVELISPMKGGAAQLVRVRGGELKHDIDFAIADPRLMQARASLVFEVLPVDAAKLTSEEKSTLRTTRTNPEELIDRESGLVTPTFAGPLWLRDEAGGGALLPTDDLTAGASGEKVREALRPLANVTVDKLLERMTAQERSYRSRMKAISSLANVVKSGNLEYVPLQNEAHILSLDEKLASNNRGLPQQGAAAQVLRFLNSKFNSGDRLFGPKYSNFPLKETVTQQTLADLVEGRRELDPTLASRLCVLMMAEMPNKMSPGGQFAFNGATGNFFADDCIKRLGGVEFGYGKQPLSDLFTIERKIRVFEKSDVEFLNGRGLGLAVGADVSFGRSNAESVSDSIGFSPTKVIESLGKIPMLSFLNIPSALGISAGRTKAWTDNKSISEGSAFKTGVNINLEQIELKMTLKRYETCAVIRVNPKFWDANLANLRYLNPRLTAEQKLEILSRGMMVCSGYEAQKPIEVKERYFAFAQGYFDETLQDRGDLRNHPWLLMLRGVRDYAQFISLLEAKKANAAQVTDIVDTGAMPLDRLKHAYENAMPGVPGVYSIDPNVGMPRVVGNGN